MPYINPEDRKRVDKYLPPKAELTPGELNYLITKILHQHIEVKGLSYTVLNEVVGTLECVKQELYRRVAVPYENSKLATNGDV